MIKVAALLFIIFIAALGYLAILNNDSVTLKLSEQYSYEIPKIALILLSSALGAFSILVLVAVRDTRRYIENLQNLRMQKKGLKIQEFYSKGLEAFFASRYEEAAEFFNRIIQQEPTNVNTLLRLGDIAFNEGDLKTAKDFYIKAKEIRPQSIEILFPLEKVFEAEQKWQEALRYLDNILEIDEENPKALYRKREIHEINRNWELLLDTQYKILKSDIPQKEKDKEHKNLFGYKYELGRYYLEKGDTEKAKKILRSVIKREKDFIAAYLALAELYIRDNDLEKAEDILIKGYEATSAIVLLIRLEDFFIDIGEPGRIIDLYQKAIQKNPKDPMLQFLLAKLYYRLEMVDYALEIVTGIDTTALDYPDFHILSGNVYKRHMQYDKAAEEFKKALVRFGMPFPVSSFSCSHCNYTTKEWVGRCSECKQWNTLTLNSGGICKT